MLPLSLLLLLSNVAVEPLSGPEILARMSEADTRRADALQNYTGLRRYVLVNERFHKRAEVLARITYKRPGEKSFEVLSESGPGILRSRVLRRMIEEETRGSQGDRRNLSRISPENYEVRVAGAELVEGRPAYVLELTPKSGSPYLVRGRAWVDAEEFAVARLEGTLAKNPSFWTRETSVVHRYAKHGPFWLPVSNESTTDARLFGKSEVKIDCYDYQVREAAEPVTSGERARREIRSPGESPLPHQ